MPPRGLRTRGRGRGGATASTQETANNDPIEHVLDPMLNQLRDIPVQSLSTPGFLESSRSVKQNSVSAMPSQTESSSGNPGSTTAKPVAAKFKPRMVRRVEKVEAEGDSTQPDPAGSQTLHPGRGRGRGRGGADRGGRGRPEIVMTASGAFAMGPAEASARSRIQGPTRSGMRKIDNSAMPTNERGRTFTAGSSTAYDSGMLELYSDADENGSDDQAQDDGSRARIADLNDITLENEMAPSSLPWDPKRIAERERLIQERNQKIMKLSSLKIKQEAQDQRTDDLKETKPQLFDRSISEVSPSQTPSIVGLPSREATIATTTELSSNDASLIKVEKPANQQIIKSEIECEPDQIDELLNVGKQFLPKQTRSAKASKPGSEGLQLPGSNGPETGAGSSLYVFQFPRTFPKFQDPTTPLVNKESAAGNQSTAPRKIIRKKKKPGLDDWLGWGRGGRRTDRMGVPGNDEDGTGSLKDDANNVQGQIGELVIRRSGRVQMIIANVAYDVLPGSQPSFHQEIAVIDPKPDSNLRAMFVLGSTSDKFIVAPDIYALLKQEQRGSNQ